MKKTYIIYFMLATLCALCGCDSNGNTTYTPSSDPTVATMSFASNDSFPALSKTIFTIEDRIDTGIIYNVDSITYGTPIDSVVPRFTFNGSVVSAAIIYTPTDTVSISGTDTIDFSQRPVLLQVIAETGTAQKWYEIEVNVHQTDPDLYQWDLLTDNILAAEYSSQKAVILNDKIYLYASNGVQATALSSLDGSNWQAATVPFSNFDVNNVLVHNSKIYCLNGNQLAVSDGNTWNSNSISSSLQIERLVFSYNDSLWAIALDGASGQRLLASYVGDGNEWVAHQTLTDDFPTTDFAALAFSSPTGRRRAMIVGGYNSKGTSLNTRWNVEYDKTNGYRWENFSIEQPSFNKLTGASIVWYNKHFLMFGGMYQDTIPNTADILESYDEGMNWFVADSAHNHLPDTYQPRAYQSAVVDSKNNIYLIGGKTETEVFQDVYKGKLNSINW